MNTFQWIIFMARITSMTMAAMFTANLLRMLIPGWRTFTRAQRAWGVALLAYSLNVTVFVSLIIGSRVAVFPDSIIWAGHALSFGLLHRALYISKERPA